MGISDLKCLGHLVDVVALNCVVEAELSAAVLSVSVTIASSSRGLDMFGTTGPTLLLCIYDGMCTGSHTQEAGGKAPSPSASGVARWSVSGTVDADAFPAPDAVFSTGPHVGPPGACVLCCDSMYGNIDGIKYGANP